MYEVSKMRSGRTREYIPAKPRLVATPIKKPSRKVFQEEEEEEEKEKSESESERESSAATPQSLPEPEPEEEDRVRPQQPSQDDDEDTSSASDSDEAPEEFGFQEAKETVVKEIKDRKEQVKEEEEKKKSLKKRRLDQWKQEKEEKLQKEKDKALAAHLLAQIEEEQDKIISEPASKKSKKSGGKVTKFHSTAGSRIAVVSKKEEKSLNHVAESVLNFKERMMFGGQRARQREPAKVAAMRRDKMKHMANVMAK